MGENTSTLGSTSCGTIITVEDIFSTMGGTIRNGEGVQFWKGFYMYCGGPPHVSMYG